MKDFLFCLVGPSGSGKTTIAYELQKRHGYNVIEPYTTRLPRYKGEKGHIFVDELEGAWNPFPWIDGKALPENVIAYNKYNDYEYWATKEQYQGKGVSLYVVDVFEAEMLRKMVKDAEIVVIALWTGKNERIFRLRNKKIRELHKADPDFKYPPLTAMERLEIKERVNYDDKEFEVIPCNYAVDTSHSIGKVAGIVNNIIQSVCI